MRATKRRAKFVKRETIDGVIWDRWKIPSPPAKNRHAVALGRKGGRVVSERKSEAARSNGKKGGRPRKPKDEA